ncbi:hypothetical protein ACH3XW_37340 [Acanthocheilonema viteae]
MQIRRSCRNDEKKFGTYCSMYHFLMLSTNHCTESLFTIVENYLQMLMNEDEILMHSRDTDNPLSISMHLK